jgi:uroporphyrinogen-III synthase
MLARSRIAVIGEVTRRAVEKREFRVDIMPETYTLKGMVDAAAAYFARNSSAAPR